MEETTMMTVSYKRNWGLRIVAAALFLATAGGMGCGLHVGGLGCEDESCMPPPEQSSPNTYTCECTCKAYLDWQGRVIASDDDAEETDATGSVSLVGMNLDIPIAANTDQHVGVRFQGVQIPPGAHVVSAYIEFTAATDASVPVSVNINGEASDNPAPFTSAAKNLTTRQFTVSAVPWVPGAWKKDSTQVTPGLETIIQEIVDRPGWADGNAIVLMMKKESGAGARAAYSFDAQPMGAPLLVVKYEDPNTKPVGPQAMPVCMPESLNANLGGTEPDGDKMQNDCQYRVGPTFAGLAGACNYPTDCSCVAIPDSKKFTEKCDDPCAENPVDAGCTNFDPDNDILEATNAPGDPAVCLANCPLSFGMFGHRSECEVEGTAQMSMAGEQVEPAVRGIVQFRGQPCADGNCPVGIEYSLDVDDVRFETLFRSEKFEELAGIGESIPGSDAFLERGAGVFAPGDLVTSVRGRRGREQQALTVPNVEPINVTARFGSTAPTCSIKGAMIGKDDAGVPTLAMGLELHGNIVNQPPTADAGDDQVVQCPARVTLDGSASTDPDRNIAVYTWIRGDRAGHQVGARAVSQVEQRPGKDTYVLRVIDERGQSNEDTSDVTVIDTVAPQVKCSVRTASFAQPNRTLTDVGFVGTARDACEGTLPVTVDVFSDETAIVSRSKPAPDAQISQGSIKLRQDRRSDGNGRVYLIRVSATDSSGHQGVDCCTVVMPKSSSKTELLSAQKQAKAARALCLANPAATPSGFTRIGAK
jgi:hypothetical protein